MADFVMRDMRPRGSLCTYADLHQTACVAGIGAIRSAEGRGGRPARRFVVLAMRSAVYRDLGKADMGLVADEDDADGDRPDDRPTFDSVEARDALALYLPSIDQTYAMLLVRWTKGESVRDIATTDGVSKSTVWAQIQRGIDAVRQVAHGAPRRSTGQRDALAGQRQTPTPRTPTPPARHPRFQRKNGVRQSGDAAEPRSNVLPKRQGVAGGGGNDSLLLGDGNGWAREICDSVSERKLTVASLVHTEQVLMAEHTHMLLEKLIAATQANAEELRLLRLALTPPPPERWPPVPPPEVGQLAHARAVLATAPVPPAKRVKGATAR